MPPPRISNHQEHKMKMVCSSQNNQLNRNRRRRRSATSTPCGGSCSFVTNMTQLALLIATTCLLLDSSTTTTLTLFIQPPTCTAEPHSTIPRSNNRYTNYHNTYGDSSSSSSASLDTLSSPLNKESYHPPWNPSPRISPHGFLTSTYTRTPGEWEPLANLRGKHGPRNPRRYYKTLSIPVQIRQVPGDGNCLFHSIACCLYYTVNGTHIPMDSYECIGDLRRRSLELRNCAVDILQQQQQHKQQSTSINSLGNSLWNTNGRRLFLQGEEYLEANELLNAAASQFDLVGDEYCELMRKESYWGGGPEIVALCNYLQRPIHIYELIAAEDANTSSDNNNNQHNPSTHNNNNNIKTCKQFTLRRMACFGSPKFDRREPLHILSADSRFPDVEPRRIRKVGNHFLALFPVNTIQHVAREGESEEGNSIRFRRHALIRGGSRMVDGSGNGSESDGRSSSTRKNDRRRKNGEGDDSGSSSNNENRISHRSGRWYGGLGSWTNNVLDWFVKDDVDERYI